MSQLDLAFASGDLLSVRRLTIREGISSLFEVLVVARTPEHSVNLEAIVGREASLRAVSGYVNAANGGLRSWTGICNYAEQIQGINNGGDNQLSTYQFRISPTLWLLTQRQNSRIFQHLSIPDIVDKLLADWPVTAEWKIERAKYQKLEYKVQYGETDFAFLSRLLEEAGIAFSFANEEGKESGVIFSDKLQKGAPRATSVHYVDNPNQSSENEFVTKVRLTHEVRPGAYTLRDYDFRNPAFGLLGEAPKTGSDAETKFERYHYHPGSMLVEGGKGGGTPTADDKGVARYEQNHGVERATRALEAERVGKRAIAFETNVIDLWPGLVFGMDHHPHAELAEKLLVTSMLIEYTEGEGWNMGATAVFAADPYRPAIRTPKPQVHGVQSAMVVGPKGQEIHTDEFGRVRVQFPWDREGKGDDGSSSWIRVSQGWGGTGFGMVSLPRIGQEVLVGFLDGDPDQPIVTGRVFNAIQGVPYKLPDNKTVSG
jgi:type VI secretion system secreted protein VgrG